MLKIIVAPLNRFRAGQHLNLMTETLRLVMETPGVMEVQPLIPALRAAVDNESIAYKLEQGSSITKLMDKSDDLRERYCSGLGYLVEMGLCHFDFTLVEAAEAVKRVIDKYGNMRSKTNVEETTAIRSMNRDLRAPATLPYTNALGGLVWIDKIDEENEKYAALSAQRTKEEGERPGLSTRETRAVADPCYNAIVDRINALAVINGEANYSSFITQLNSTIEGMKNTLAQQQGLKKKEESAKTA
jgi:hypothetical protein